VVDESRSRSRRGSTVALDGHDVVARETTEQLAIDGISADAAVRALVAGLCAEQAEVVLLRVLGDLDTETVGKVLGKSAGAVRVAQHRALQRLRRQWTEPAVTL
jgi:RNA polymerase sigma-70 factor, ECF subfamily